MFCWQQCFQLYIHLTFRCKCGHCSLAFIETPDELRCCAELEKCRESLESDIVLADFEAGTQLKCITDHPGFAPVCLEKWSLRMSAIKFKTKARKGYQQIGGNEEK